MQKRKRPLTASPVQVDNRLLGRLGVVEKSDDLSGGDTQENSKFLVQLADALAADVRLDPADREFLIDQYAAALDGAVERSAQIEPITKASWLKTVELLGNREQSDQSEKGAAVREFDSAMEPINSDKLRKAEAYLAKLQEDGAEAALLWLTSQNAHNNADAPAIDAGLNHASPRDLSQAITRSKSRRLRGPPSA